MPKFDTYPSSGALLSTDLFGISRSPFTPGTFFSTTPVEITGYVGNNILIDVDQISNIGWASTFGYLSLSSATNITLSNPLSSKIAINMTVEAIPGTPNKVILPEMNEITDNLDIDSTFTLLNTSSSLAFNVYKNDNSTFVASVYPGQQLELTVTDNSTANGTFSTNFIVNSIANYSSVTTAANLSLSLPMGTGLVTRLFTVTTGSKTITLPSMNSANSPDNGTIFIFRNASAGSNTFALNDASAGVLKASFIPGMVLILQLISKSTTAGTFAVLYDSSLSAFGNSGLRVYDTDTSNLLTIKPGSNLTSDRIFTLTTGDAARTLDISASDVTITTFGANLIDSATAGDAIVTLGLGDMSLQNSTNVSITGGFIAADGFKFISGGAGYMNLAANSTAIDLTATFQASSGTVAYVPAQVDKSLSYTLASTDYGNVIAYEGTSALRTITLDANATLPASFNCKIINGNGNYFMLLAIANGATLNGKTYFYLPPMSAMELYTYGAVAWYTTAFTNNLSLTGTTTGIQTTTLTNSGVSIEIPTDTVMNVSFDLMARRTDVAGDGGAWRVFAAVKNVAGTCSIIGATTTAIGQSTAGLTSNLSISGTQLIIAGQFTAITSVYSWLANNFTIGVEQ